MPRKAAKKYGRDGLYYRKRIKTPEGKYEDVYGRTQAELAEKVTLRLNQLAAAGAAPPDQIFFFEYAAGWYARREPHLSPGMRKMVKHEINDVICPARYQLRRRGCRHGHACPPQPQRPEQDRAGPPSDLRRRP